MRVKEAKAIASQWVNEEATNLPGFAGAFFHGSINWLADDHFLAATSDLDIMVLFADPPPVKLGKFVYRDLLLEVSYLAQTELASPEQVLSQSHMAGSFQGASLIADPNGQLTAIQAVVARDYAKRQWVYRRCEDAREKILRNLEGIRHADFFHDQVSAWLFATGVTTHVLLVAGLKNPTVRRRYVAVHDLLAAYGHLDFYEILLDLLGCRQMTQEQVADHLRALTTVFDVAKEKVQTPFFFASDISDLARPIAIDGSRELIEAGLHREAIFWIVATYARCLKILHHDAPAELYAKCLPGFHHLVGDLGIQSPSDLQQRGEAVRAFLPPLWQMTEAILAANPDVK